MKCSLACAVVLTFVADLGAASSSESNPLITLRSEGGVELLVEERPGDDQLARVLVVVGVGTQSEGAGQSQAAELSAATVLVAQTSEGVSVEEYLAFVGGSSTVRVGRFETSFRFVAPRSRLRDFLALLPGQLWQPPDPAAFAAARERGRAVERIKARDARLQAGQLVESLMRTGAVQVRAQSVGAGGDRAAAVAALRSRHYRPDNTVVGVTVASGGRSVADLLATQFVGDSLEHTAQVSAPASSPASASVPAAGDRSSMVRCLRFPGLPLDQLVLGFPLPAIEPPASALVACEAVAQLLGSSQSSRLHRRLRLEEALAYTVEARCRHLGRARYAIEVACRTQDASSAHRAILDELKGLFSTALTESEFVTAVRMLRSRFAIDHENQGELYATALALLGVEPRVSRAAREQALAQLLAGDLGLKKDWLEVRDITTVLAASGRRELCGVRSAGQGGGR